MLKKKICNFIVYAKLCVDFIIQKVTDKSNKRRGEGQGADTHTYTLNPIQNYHRAEANLCQICVEVKL